jgi:hypothetical protein
MPTTLTFSSLFRTKIFRREMLMNFPGIKHSPNAFADCSASSGTLAHVAEEKTGKFAGANSGVYGLHSSIISREETLCLPFTHLLPLLDRSA